ncbi:hypothetical protein PIROE2DRAFT_2317 [Piromyces sp. E2]|nr:hypothetical protein PIROE2DRAFT_2317 [Piromyces sp. E2]|eukprot:OUM69686.1 hypothetical protein PIROE2DRAFT_2317 [Piromyces sp. E2]
MLDQTIKSLDFKDNQYHLDCEYSFTSDHLITSIDYLKDYNTIETVDYHKAIIITDRSLKKDVDISIYVIPPNTINNNKNRIMLIQQGYQANCCPKSKYIVYICTKATETSKEEIKSVIQQLFEDKIDESEKVKVDEIKKEDGEDKKEEDNEENKEVEEEEEDDDDDDEDDDEEEEGKEEMIKPKAYLSIIYRQSIRKQKSSDSQENKSSLTVIDDMLPGISMETPVENALNIFRQLHPEIKEIYAKPQEQEEKEEKEEEKEEEEKPSTQEEEVTTEDHSREETTQETTQAH